MSRVGGGTMSSPSSDHWFVHPSERTGIRHESMACKIIQPMYANQGMDGHTTDWEDAADAVAVQDEELDMVLAFSEQGEKQ